MRRKEKRKREREREREKKRKRERESPMYTTMFKERMIQFAASQSRFYSLSISVFRPENSSSVDRVDRRAEK